jgi:hypothetical protein
MLGSFIPVVGEAFMSWDMRLYEEEGNEEAADEVERQIQDSAILASIGTPVVKGLGIRRALKAATKKGAVGCTHSFDPATPVKMADGSTKAIKDVRLGEKVVATEPETGVTTVQTVTALHVNQDTDLTDVAVKAPDGRTTVLETTEHHPFWDVTTGEWVNAADLQVGHLLRDDAGANLSTVVGIRVFAGSQEMRDLTVDNVHTYYVVAGNTPVLVHNCGGYFPGHAESCTCEGIGDITWGAAATADEAADFSGHALQRLEQRGVSVEQARTVLAREPFSYYHDGVWKSGYYDPSSKVLIAKTIDGNINTVMTNVDRAYIRRLQGGR